MAVNTGSHKSSNSTQQSSGTKDIRSLLILLLVIVGALCAATAVYLPELQAASAPDMVLNRLLQKNAARSNKNCPRNLNQYLRLDNFEAGDKRMTIHYTLLEVSSSDINGDDLKPSVTREIRRGVCRERNSAELLKQGVAFVFAVHGKDGGLVFDYQVFYEDCEYT